MFTAQIQALVEDAAMLAIIGGTGLSKLGGFDHLGTDSIATEYAEAKVELQRFTHSDVEFIFLPRHGGSHQTAPHQINYRANMDALAQAGVTAIVAINAVGGIHEDLGPGAFAVPDQIIDYSHSRETSFFDGVLKPIDHIDFTYPYSDSIRQRIIAAAKLVNSRNESTRAVLAEGTYGCTQGPRLETAAEVTRLLNDGCDMVGMTGMPEAALAREVSIEYASLALSVNWAAGLSEEAITLADIHVVLEEGMTFVSQVLNEIISQP